MGRSHPETPTRAAAPFDSTFARLVARLNADLVVIDCARIHREPQLFVRVKTRRPGWCRVSAIALPKGAMAFAPLRRAAAYSHVSAELVERARVGDRLR